MANMSGVPVRFVPYHAHGVYRREPQVRILFAAIK